MGLIMKFADKFVGLVHLWCLIWAYQQHIDLLTVWSWLIVCDFKIHVVINKSGIHILILHFQPGWIRVLLWPPYPEFVPFQEPMSSESAKTADLEAGRCHYQRPGQPTFSRSWSTVKSGPSRVSSVTYPMMSTSRVTTVMYPMSSNSQQPLAACRTLMNILCGIAVALAVFLALYFYCTAVAASSCPVHGQYLCSLNTKCTLSHTAGWHVWEVAGSNPR